MGKTALTSEIRGIVVFDFQSYTCVLQGMGDTVFRDRNCGVRWFLPVVGRKFNHIFPAQDTEDLISRILMKIWTRAIWLIIWPESLCWGYDFFSWEILFEVSWAGVFLVCSCTHSRLLSRDTRILHLLSLAISIFYSYSSPNEWNVQCICVLEVKIASTNIYVSQHQDAVCPTCGLFHQHVPYRVK
jgi:hypothetical protein